MTQTLDDLTVLQIELAAVRVCCNRSDHDPLLVPGDQMRDNDYRAAIREVFGSEPEWEDWMVDPLLVQVKREIAFREAGMQAASMILGSMMR